MLNITVGMKLKSSKTNKTYEVKTISEQCNKVYMSDIEDNESLESHVLEKVLECLKNGYYTIVEDIKEIRKDNIMKITFYGDLTNKNNVRYIKEWCERHYNDFEVGTKEQILLKNNDEKLNFTVKKNKKSLVVYVD